MTASTLGSSSTISRREAPGTEGVVTVCSEPQVSVEDNLGARSQENDISFGIMAIPRPQAMSMRRPLLLLTMALSLSVGAPVHAADDFLLSRFSDYLESLRT